MIYNLSYDGEKNSRKVLGSEVSGYLVPFLSSRSTKFVGFSISASHALLPHGEKVTKSASFTEHTFVL